MAVRISVKESIAVSIFSQLRGEEDVKDEGSSGKRETSLVLYTPFNSESC